jgi:hypothetical protein
MLALKYSLLNTEYVLINALKALVTIVFMGVHVILLSNITPRHFTLFTKGMFFPFLLRKDSGGLVL